MLTESPSGKAVPVIAQDVTPVVVGVCVAAIPSVSTTVAGVNAMVGFGIRTARFKVAAVEPVEFAAVIV